MSKTFGFGASRKASLFDSAKLRFAEAQKRLKTALFAMRGRCFVGKIAEITLRFSE